MPILSKKIADLCTVVCLILSSNQTVANHASDGPEEGAHSSFLSDHERWEFIVQSEGIQATMSSEHKLADGSVAMFGRVAPSRLSAEAGEIAMLKHRGGIDAVLRWPDKVLSVWTAADGSTVAATVDPYDLPSDGLEDAFQVPEMRFPGSLKLSQAQKKDSVSVIRVLGVFTKEAVNEYSGAPAALLNLALAEANQGFANSGVRVRLELAAVHLSDYSETGNIGVDLARIREKDEGVLEEVHGLRDVVKADVVALVVNNAVVCGLASGYGSEPGTAFVAVRRDCVLANFSLTHELGHLMWAQHDYESDPHARPFAFAHGHRQLQAGNSWRTVMAVPCSGAACPRINRWSDPNALLGLDPLGVNGVSENVRLLNETAPVISDFR